ncbi:MAG TPA: glutamate-cysteine ligase family protein [Polyangiaceae bacterium]|nr:glutamate-cysteine ligase family protein [Polyangiaceae bacterium]
MRAAAVTTEPQLLEPIRRREDLLAPFTEAFKPRDAWRIGPEMEKFGVFEAGGKPVPYAGERSILAILEELVKSHGWTPEREHADGPIVALARGEESVTLEPAGQLELSGGKSEDVHQVSREIRRHLREIEPASRAMGIRWLGIGFHPFARREDFAWVPKQRYGVMRDYLPTRGGHALDMMLRTCTVQANFDYASEADAMRKMRVGLALAPLTTAVFANSPWKEGRPHGGLSYRGRVWLDVDPDRTGLLPVLWKAGARLEDYVEWALDVPMFLFKRSGRPVLNTGQTFRSFWRSGFAGYAATLDDWRLHLNTLFPEVRLKKTIEVRAADVQATELACALPALWTGIFYDDRALAQAEALVVDWTHEDVARLRQTAWREGLRASFRGQSLAAIAARVLEVSAGGLERRARIDPTSGKDERVYLSRLAALVASARTPADVLLDGIDREPDLAAAIVDRAAIPWE